MAIHAVINGTETTRFQYLRNPDPSKNGSFLDAHGLNEK